MKRILFTLLLAIVGTTVLFAQDIIITKESECIDAKILEISDDEILYKSYGDTAGQVISIKTSDVTNIVFANGETYYPEEGIETDKINNHNEEKQIQDTIFDPIPITLKTGKTIMFEYGTELVGIYYGEYGKLKYRELGDFVRQTCPNAYYEFKKTNRCLAFGSCLLPIGLSTAIYGHILLAGANDYEQKLGGYALAILGWCIVEVSLDLYVVAVDHSIKVSTVFNENCAKSGLNHPQTSLSLSLSPTSMGLTFKF